MGCGLFVDSLWWGDRARRRSFQGKRGGLLLGWVEIMVGGDSVLIGLVVRVCW